MFQGADQINKYQTRRPLVGRAAPNFRSKRDKEKVKPLVRKKEQDREENHDRPEGQGEELDRYI